MKLQNFTLRYVWPRPPQWKEIIQMLNTTVNNHDTLSTSRQAISESSFMFVATSPTTTLTPTSTSPTTGLTPASTSPTTGLTPASNSPSGGLAPASTSPTTGLTPASTSRNTTRISRDVDPLQGWCSNVMRHRSLFINMNRASSVNSVQLSQLFSLPARP